tara:strand:+ start:7598 stop:8401 length:804 start_codon:yes stop_codon:yes gene_type:complete
MKITKTRLKEIINEQYEGSPQEELDNWFSRRLISSDAKMFLFKKLEDAGWIRPKSKENKMKITEQRLKEIIKEEVEKVVKEALEDSEAGSRYYQNVKRREDILKKAIKDGLTFDQVQSKYTEFYDLDPEYYEHLKTEKPSEALEEAIALKKPGKDFKPRSGYGADPRTEIVNANVGKLASGLGLTKYIRKNVKGEWIARIGPRGVKSVNTVDPDEEQYMLVDIQLSKSPKEILKEALQNKEILAKLERKGLVKKITVPIDYIDSIRD